MPRIARIVIPNYPHHFTHQFAHWSDYLQTENSGIELNTTRKHARTGRLIQDEIFLTELEKITGKD